MYKHIKKYYKMGEYKIEVVFESKHSLVCIYKSVHERIFDRKVNKLIFITDKRKKFYEKEA